MVQNMSRASFGSFSGGRSTMAENSARSLGIRGRDIATALTNGANTYRSFRRLRQQRLAGLHAGEHDRLGGDLEAVAGRTHHRVVRLRKLGRLRKVLAVVRAA